MSDNETWYKNPYRWVDPEDLFEGGHTAYAFFQDMIVNRPVEFQAFIHLFHIAYRMADRYRDELTTRQQQAFRLAGEAVVMGLTPSNYVAQHLGVGVRAAQRLLKRADQRIMFVSGDFPRVHGGSIEIEWTPSPEMVKQKVAGLKVECAGYGHHDGCKHLASGRYGICYPCFKHFGFEGERENSLYKDWLTPLIRQIKNDAEREARNLLYMEYRSNGQQAVSYEDYAEAA